MEQRPLEVNSDSNGQEIASLLWNPKVHYNAPKSPPLDPIPCQMNPTHIITHCLRSIIILFSQLRMDVLSGLFLSDFPAKVVYACLTSSMRVKFPAHPSSFIWSIMSGEDVNFSHNQMHPFFVSVNVTLTVKWYRHRESKTVFYTNNLREPFSTIRVIDIDFMSTPMQWLTTKGSRGT
jgi:hypothetical protein